MTVMVDYRNSLPFGLLFHALLVRAPDAPTDPQRNLIVARNDSADEY
jgi:hypothetical protein